MRIAVASIALVLLAPAVAEAAPHVVLTDDAAFVEHRDDRTILVHAKAPAQPGQQIRFTLTARNDGDRPAANLVPQAKLPPGMTFLAAVPATNAEFSLDGGKTWAHAPKVRDRAASAADYTAIRWVNLPPLAAGARATFTYDVVLK